MADIFISYANEDRLKAEALAKILQKHNWTVWWDRKIPPGKSFEEVIEQAITEARCVIVLWSKTSITSDWVRSEVQEGIRRRILVPILIEGIDTEKIPLSSRRLQAANLADWTPGTENEELIGLIDSVRSILSTSVVLTITDSSYFVPAPTNKDAIGTKPNNEGKNYSANPGTLRNANETGPSSKLSAFIKILIVVSKLWSRWQYKIIFTSIALILSGILFIFGQPLWVKLSLVGKSPVKNSGENIDFGNIKKIPKTSASVDTTQKPSIEIIDPKIVIQPGKIPIVRLRSPVKELKVIGKTYSPAGISTVLVNSYETTIVSNIFSAKILIQDKNTPVYVASVDKNGEVSRLEFILSVDSANSSDQESIKPSPQILNATWKNIDFGNYYALIIGINHYTKIPSLDTAINDAKAVDKVLREKYDFKTTLLIDANRDEILTAMNELLAKLTENDNLLIYYAGHSELDKVNGRGYWLPVDADADKSSNWISTAKIKDILNTMSARQILVIADSDSMVPNRSLEHLQSFNINQNKKVDWVKAVSKQRTRNVLTTGGLASVADGGANEHSLFASIFIKALKENKSLLSGQELSLSISDKIISSTEQLGADQLPGYGQLSFAGHENGEFFFIPK
jgi:TIR domain/Caspase domain